MGSSDSGPRRRGRDMDWWAWLAIGVVVGTAAGVFVIGLVMANRS